MKFKITLKDACGVAECMYYEAIKESLRGQRDALTKVCSENVYHVLNKYFKYKKYLVVEIDTDAGTCVVVQR